VEVPAGVTDRWLPLEVCQPLTIPKDKIEAIMKWTRYGEEEKQAVARLLDDNEFYDEIPLLEKEMKEYLQVPYVKAHMNGTSALESLFFALDLPPGSEILAPSYTAWATTAPMHIFGYVPAFVDIDPHTMTFDVEYARRCVNSRSKAVLPMHSFGNPCDMDAITQFARDHGLIVLEDAAQAFGASVKGKPVGTGAPSVSSVSKPARCFPVLKAAWECTNHENTTSGLRPTAITSFRTLFHQTVPIVSTREPGWGRSCASIRWQQQ